MRDLKPTRLVEARKAKGLNKSELARLAGMQAGTIAWIESGRLYPYETQAVKIAAALGYEGDPATLFEAVE